MKTVNYKPSSELAKEAMRMNLQKFFEGMLNYICLRRNSDGSVESTISEHEVIKRGE